MIAQYDILYFTFSFHSKIVKGHFCKRIWGFDQFSQGPLLILWHLNLPCEVLIPSSSFSVYLIDQIIVCPWICTCFKLSSRITLINFTKPCIFHKICRFILPSSCSVLPRVCSRDWQRMKWEVLSLSRINVNLFMGISVCWLPLTSGTQISNINTLESINCILRF